MFNPSLIYDTAFEALEATYLGETKKDGVHFPYSPLPTSYFINQLSWLDQQRPGCKFLEVGCGIGTKLLLAKLAGFDVVGFDIDPNYIEKAQQLFAKANVNGEIFCLDALDFDRYGEFDVIFNNHPFVNPEDEEKLETKILETVQPSAILFMPITDFPLKKGWQMIKQDIWIK